jgi:DnaJ-domain-containing protein 1
MSGYKTDPTKGGSPNEWRAAFRDRMGIDAARQAVNDSGETPRGILGVLRSATWDEIRKAYRKLVMLHHPDRGGDAGMFRKIQAAYEVLEDALLNGKLAGTA